MDLLKDLYNYEKYINKQYTSEQKEQYIKCIELLKEQNHSNHSINFVVNKFIDLLTTETNYNKVLQENIKHFSKQKEGYIDVLILKYVEELLNITSDLEVAKLLGRYKDYGIVGTVKLEETNFKSVSETLKQHKYCSSFFLENNKVNYIEAIVFDLYKDNKYKYSITTNNRFDKKHNLLLNSSLEVKKKLILPKIFHIRCIEKENSLTIFDEDINKYNEAIKYYGDN